MTEQECHELLMQICNQLEAEDANLRFDIRTPGIFEEEKIALGAVYVVVIRHKELESDVITGSRESYNYSVCGITRDAMAYKTTQYFTDIIKDAAKRVQNQFNQVEVSGS